MTDKITDNDEQIHQIVRDRYGKIAKSSCGCASPYPCCGGTQNNLHETISEKIGYSPEEIKSVPEGANLGLGCGNPVAMASLKEGETVLDLGSGAGFDCFLAAQRVGKTGKVIGIDMTPEMLKQARENARKSGYTNVEFRQGEIEKLPVTDNTVDIIISNCVINLSPDKKSVFKEAFRVLKPGGRLMVSDMVLLKPLPQSVKESVEAYVGCLAGAIMRDVYIKAIEGAGFHKVNIVEETTYPIEFLRNDPLVSEVIQNFQIPRQVVAGLGDSFESMKVSAVKPG